MSIKKKRHQAFIIITIKIVSRMVLTRSQYRQLVKLGDYSSDDVKSSLDDNGVQYHSIGSTLTDGMPFAGMDNPSLLMHNQYGDLPEFPDEVSDTYMLCPRTWRAISIGPSYFSRYAKFAYDEMNPYVYAAYMAIADCDTCRAYVIDCGWMDSREECLIGGREMLAELVWNTDFVHCKPTILMENGSTQRTYGLSYFQISHYDGFHHEFWGDTRISQRAPRMLNVEEYARTCLLSETICGYMLKRDVGEYLNSRALHHRISNMVFLDKVTDCMRGVLTDTSEINCIVPGVFKGALTSTGMPYVLSIGVCANGEYGIFDTLTGLEVQVEFRYVSCTYGQKYECTGRCGVICSPACLTSHSGPEAECEEVVREEFRNKLMNDGEHPAVYKSGLHRHNPINGIPTPFATVHSESMMMKVDDKLRELLAIQLNIGYGIIKTTIKNKDKTRIAGLHALGMTVMHCVRLMDSNMVYNTRTHEVEIEYGNDEWSEAAVHRVAQEAVLAFNAEHPFF